MNLSFIEYQPQKVLAAFRQGEFDGLEVIGQADERDFFQRCFQERLLVRLAASMPTARKKEEVPRWFILAANLSLKLHQENSFLAFERVVRCGGLLAALPPDLAAKHLDAQTRQWALHCQGFNAKNSYDRATPCDQDTLRKALKDVSATAWLEWFNGSVQQVFQADGFFDPEGIFIGDGSYLFVPDNPAYEGSVVMWFDEHNHPVDYEKLSPEQRPGVHRERCYKWIPRPARSACGDARPSGKRPWPKGSKPCHRHPPRNATPIASIAGLEAFAVGRRRPCPSRSSASGIIMPTDITKLGP
jgi:hypothetical protein